MREWPYTASSRDALYIPVSFSIPWYCIRTLPRRGMYWGVHWDVQPNTSRFEAVYGHSLIINPSLGMYQEKHPCRASSTYNVKINTWHVCTIEKDHW